MLLSRLDVLFVDVNVVVDILDDAVAGVVVAVVINVVAVGLL